MALSCQKKTPSAPIKNNEVWLHQCDPVSIYIHRMRMLAQAVMFPVYNWDIFNLNFNWDTNHPD